MLHIIYVVFMPPVQITLSSECDFYEHGVNSPPRYDEGIYWDRTGSPPCYHQGQYFDSFCPLFRVSSRVVTMHRTIDSFAVDVDASIAKQTVDILL